MTKSFYSLNASQLLQRFKANPHGLSSREAKKRLAQYGPNTLAEEEKESLLEKIWEAIREPMVLLLLLAMLLFFFFGDKGDALIMLIFGIIPIVAIEFFLESRTEKTLAALTKLIEPKVHVLRDGQEQLILSEELVPGDIVVLQVGDVVTADARLIETNYLTIDESSLTGEPIPVEKDTKPLTNQNLSITDQTNMVFAGTKIAEGEGKALVVTTGKNSEYGKISELTLSLKVEKTPLEKKANEFTKWLALAGGGVTAFIVLIGIVQGIGIVPAILRGLASAMAAIPEELPIIYTVFLAVGVWQMAKKKALIRRMPAVETLGSVTTICTDKTGTITRGELGVEKLFCTGEVVKSSGSNFAACKTFFSFPWLLKTNDAQDPFEKGLQGFVDTHTSLFPSLASWIAVEEFPYDPKTKARSSVVKNPVKQFVVLTRGAPEFIVEMCNASKEEKERVLRANTKFAEEGLRVIAFVYKTMKDSPKNRADAESNLTFAALIGFHDPIRTEVADALKLAKQAGIRVIMITGDQKATALSIAEKICLSSKEVLTGSDLATFSDEELKKHVKQTNIFARVLPQDKLRIVQALKSLGEVVSMTGDGVNDAPALKAADIGVAMGIRGTEVAREASKMVLLDDNFSTIIVAVREGRRIFDNIQKSMSYFTSMKIVLLGFVTLNGLFNLPLAFFPIHIVWMELITDPTSSLVYQTEPAEPGLMHRQPRPPQTPLLPKNLFLKLITQGLAILAGTFGAYFYALSQGMDVAHARTITFSILVVSQMFLVLINRSEETPIWKMPLTTNKFLITIIVLTAIMLPLIVYVPFLQTIFKTAALTMNNWLIVIVIALVSTLWYEGVKLTRHRL